MARIDHVHIHSSHPAKTIEFFKTFFEGRVSREFEAMGRKVTVLSLDGETNLSILHVPPGVENPRPELAAVDHIGISVKNIEDLVRRLKDAGVTFTVDLNRSPSGAKVAFCLGPDNVYLEILERP